MARARELADEGAQQGTWIVARAQTEGRGRRGRTWVSGRGRGLYATLIWRPPPAHFTEGLTLAVGVAVAEVLDEHLGRPLATQIKWPNDLWLERKKVGGILVEAARPTAPDGYLLIGIGINLSAQDRGELSRHPSLVSATSLEESGPTADAAGHPAEAAGHLEAMAEQLLARLLPALAETHLQFVRHGLTPFLVRFTARDALYNQRLESEQDGTTLSGVGCGVDAAGHLLLAAEGRTLKLHAGEVERVRDLG